MKRFFSVVSGVLFFLLVICAGLLIVSGILYPSVRHDGDDRRNYADTEGLYFSVLGDSISTYKGYTSDQFPMAPYYSPGEFDIGSMWWSILAEETGMIPCMINAGSGTGVTELFPDAGIPTAGNSDRCSELRTNENTPDVVLVLLGGNDAIRHVSGNVLQEAYVEMLIKLKNEYPNAKIYACTYYLMPGVLKEGTKELNELIRSAASETGTMCLDVEDCAISSGNPEKYFIDYDAEARYGLHVNRYGQEILGRAVADKFRETVEKDSE